MTADAKVGLLLGLVFIVIIAFLVNGLPNVFRGGEATAAIDTSLPERPLGSLILQSPADAPNPRQQNDVPIRPAVAPDEVEIVQLPGVLAEAVRAEAAQATEAVAAAATTTEAAAATAAAAPRVLRHQVKDGEYLTTIACLVYGAELGRKKVTIEAIAKANGLESPDKLQVGQVLTMPDLNARPAVEQVESRGATNTLVEKFKDVLERVTTKQKDVAEAPKPDPLSRTESVKHVVQKGECLSEISSKHLGTCKRVDEIIKLNRDHIRDADDIMVGMILRLPKR